MIWFATLVLLVWFPIVYLIFESMPGEEAVVVSFVFAWLFLPPLYIPLPGIPDWSKMTATTFSIALIAFVRQNFRITRLRFQWFDLPITVFCLCPIMSALTVGAGLYDGLSAAVDQTVRWGLPYLIGRAFLGHQRGQYLMCLGLAVGGLVYAPLCLFEIRMSPVLKLWVYGFNGRAVLDFDMRYGGYRPIVFLDFGLETAWWMCCSTLACYYLWQSGTVTRLRGYPMSLLTGVMAFTSIACKSTGALVQIILGFGLFTIARRTRSVLLIYPLLLLPIMYCFLRPIGVWNGSSLLSVVNATFGPARAQSLSFRFEQEEILMQSAMGRPIFGWARAGGFNNGPGGTRLAVLDGYWIIVFGTMGGVGLAALNGMHLVPTYLFLRRFKPDRWLTPEAAPTLTFAVILPLYMLDNLSNAMLNPVYAVIMGAVSGYIPSRTASGRDRTGDRLVAADFKPDRLTARYRRSLPEDMVRDQEAAEQEAAALALADDESHEDAWEQFAAAIVSRQAAATIESTPDRLNRLARTRVQFARFLTQLGYLNFAIDERVQAVQVWRSLLLSEFVGEEILTAHASNLNDLAWLLILEPDVNQERSDQAVKYAEEAVQLIPDHAPCWNTLGISYYRRRDFYKAIHALSRAVSNAEDGGNAFDFYYLALANHALGYFAPASEWLNRADAWTAKHPECATPLQPVLAEVAQVFGTQKQG